MRKCLKCLIMFKTVLWLTQVMSSTTQVKQATNGSESKELDIESELGFNQQIEINVGDLGGSVPENEIPATFFSNMEYPELSETPTSSKKRKIIHAELTVYGLFDYNAKKSSNSSELDIFYTNCHIRVINTKNSNTNILNYLKNFCAKDENFIYSNRTTKKNITFKQCILEDKNNEKYVIVRSEAHDSNNTDQIYDMLAKICQNASHSLKEERFNSPNSTSNTSHIGIRCCMDFRFVPPDIFHTEDLTRSWEQNTLVIIVIELLFLISFICLCFICITAIVSQRFREERGNQILVQFAVSILAETILHFSACFIRVVDSFICYFISIVFQYFVLVETSWSSVIAYMQYRRYAKVLDAEPKYIMLKVYTVAYGCPILSIMIRLWSYETNHDFLKYCTFCIPQLIALIVNTVFLILIARNFVSARNEFIENRKSISMEVKLIFFLFLVLDFSWINIILSFLTEEGIFAYFFLLTRSIQGFMLFFVFGIMNKHNRLIYRKFVNSVYEKTFRKRSVSDMIAI